jgi:hypothetical protein
MDHSVLDLRKITEFIKDYINDKYKYKQFHASVIDMNNIMLYVSDKIIVVITILLSDNHKGIIRKSSFLYFFEKEPYFISYKMIEENKYRFHKNFNDFTNIILSDLELKDILSDYKQDEMIFDEMLKWIAEGGLH